MNTIITPFEEAIFEPVYTTAGSNSPYPAVSTNISPFTPPPSDNNSPGRQVPNFITNFVPVNRTFPSLFKPSAERPRFFASYRWWEDEVTTVLWAFEPQDIQRVIRYGLYPDQNLPRTALQSRHETTVVNFLAKLMEPHERPFIANLSHVQKVEEILRRSNRAYPARVPWSWFPSQIELDPRAIAVAVDAESRLHFIRIQFEELVRYSLGYEAPSVEWFLQQHTALYVHLLNYLQAFPEEIPRYAEVEKHLRKRSPFAHRALAQCLTIVSPDERRAPPLSPNPAFDFIAGPIQRLFKDHPPSLTSILKVLCVLEVRFRQTYVHVPEMNWYQYFDITVTFLGDVMESTSAVDLANTLTAIDESLFTNLSPQNVIIQSPELQQIVTNWHSLSTLVWEVCSALPDLIGYIQECVQALFLIRNYHALTAMLNGLQIYSLQAMTVNNVSSQAKLSPVLPADTFYFVDPFQNYLAYRRQFNEIPGIPFLLPHIREFKQHGESALHQFFQGLQVAAR